MRTILLPAIIFTWGMPWESLHKTHKLVTSSLCIKYLPEHNANLGRSVTLLGHVADLLDGIGSALLHP